MHTKLLRDEMILLDQEKYLHIVRYPHHTCHITLMTQDGCFSFQWLPWLLNLLDTLVILYALSMVFWLPLTHRGRDKQLHYMSLKHWLWFWGVMDNWHVISINTWSFHQKGHHLQCTSDGAQGFHTDFHGHKLSTTFGDFYDRLILRIPNN